MTTRLPVALPPSVLACYPPVATSGTARRPDPPRFSGTRIPGVRVVPLCWHVDARGGLVEVHRESWARLFDACGVGGEDAATEHVDAADPEAARAPARQVYLSATEPGAVKGWHLHLRQTDRFVCVRGRVRLVLVDLRRWDPSGPTGQRAAKLLDAELKKTGRPWTARRDVGELDRLVPTWSAVLGLDRAPVRVEIPPGVAHGWRALDGEEALVLNCVSEEYDGSDERRCDPHGPVAPGLPPFDWLKRLDG